MEAALTGSPCGGCRQFLHETAHGDELQLLLYNKSPEAPNYGKPTTLAKLNPEPFGSDGSLLRPQHVPLSRLTDARRGDDKKLSAAALEAARGAYVHKYPTASGVAIKLTDGGIYTGSYLEIAGQNPSLSPLQSALVRMMVEGRSWNGIRSAVLVQEENTPFSQVDVTRSLLKSIAPRARLTVRHAGREA
ncbi:MAG: hypothetical protein HY319_22775 [Armatimonadetes bacterium]|nr:hypothetical protein [Armatimonadota bacterium]